MKLDQVISALRLPSDARVDQRVPKKLLVENGAPTAADKRQINEGIDELQWLAALKPASIGVPVYRDEVREYLEIAVLVLRLRAEAKQARLTELVHRAIPYPVLLIAEQDSNLTLSLAHLRWSQGEALRTVLDGSIVLASLDREDAIQAQFVESLSVTAQPRRDLLAFYQGWIECLEAYAAARMTGRFTPATNPERRRTALIEHEQLVREIDVLRKRATRESQINRRVELNLEIQRLEARLTETIHHI